MKLRQLADVFLTTGRYAILHDGARRRQTITCNPSGRDVASFVADAQTQNFRPGEIPGGVMLNSAARRRNSSRHSAN